nr:hypothetical protein [Tanacetum cinerariifolium]
MAFIKTAFALRYLSTNNQLNTSSNLTNQATIQDGRVIVQNVQERQTQGYAGSRAKGLYREVYEMKAIFQQMETEVEQCSIDRKCVDIEKKELLIENECLLEKIICHDVMCVAMHADFENKYVLPANDDNLAYVKIEKSYIDEYSRCLELEDGLLKKNDMVEKAVYNELLNKCSRLEKRCICLEIKVDFENKCVLPANDDNLAYVKMEKNYIDEYSRGVGDEKVIVGEGVVVISSSLDMLTNSYLEGIMVSLIFLEGLDEEALVEFMVEWYEEDEVEEDELFN